MTMNNVHKIRPAGRHILTVGRDLIKDSYAAVVELVKNAYDADSPDVTIKFQGIPDQNNYSIVISDNGHGMTRDSVVNKWMVPSTKDKFDRRKSPSGRVMQGQKGVGRYAVSILGEDLLLETITNTGEKTTVYIEWDRFEAATYLDDVEILIETVKTSDSPGTRLTMKLTDNFLSEWSQKQFDKLNFELKKLISPVFIINEKPINDEFYIFIEVFGFPNIREVSEIVAPYPIFDLFDYRIAGKIGTDGTGLLTYSTQKARNTLEEKIQFDSNGQTDCGELVFDIRVYDREAEAIESLIGRGLKDDSGNYVGKLQARQILNESNGVGVYRNGFRIRPLGDPDFDWLTLNEQRIQNPSLRIGSNQVIGYVQIQSDESSGLIEKSARDGLKENMAFNRLKEITKAVVAKLEERRFEYRNKAGLSRPLLKIERELGQLFSYDELKRDIRSKLTKGVIAKNTADEIIEIIDRDAEEKNRVADEIRQTVAIYQGQATLGKIINVILHEGRRPLSYFRNQIPRIRKMNIEILNTNDSGKLTELVSITDGVGTNAEIFVDLFGRLDPLASGKRSAKKPIELKKAIENILAVFKGEMESNNIVVKIDGSDDFKFLSWIQDMSAIFTNLIDNSIYWIKEKNVLVREIRIKIVTSGIDLLYIDYHDTGPGIEPSLISNKLIFEPEFSTKPNGTGLGLAIAGESATRNGLELKAFDSDTGAYFRLQPKVKGTNE